LVVATVLLPHCLGFSSIVTARLCLPNVCGVTAFLHQSATAIYALSSSSSSWPRIGGDEKETNNVVPFDFLAQVELSVARVLKKYQSSRDDGIHSTHIEILQIPPAERETVGVALNLDQRLQALRRNNDCPRCWMQRAHCICSKCPPVDYKNNNDNNKRTTIRITSSEQQQHLNRIFLLMHHKEIGLKVDTAKLILACFPHHCRLVVAGISGDYQDSMKELEMALQTRRDKCLVLFPDDTAETFQEILLDSRNTSPATKKNGGVHHQNDGDSDNNNNWDIIVIDGTWTQARRMMSRYLPTEEDGGPRRVQLSAAAVATLDESSSSIASPTTITTLSTSRGSGMNAGHQLRRHAVTWRQVGTFGKSFEKGDVRFFNRT
jgi:DTW domain-containing protein YfiP